MEFAQCLYIVFVIGKHTDICRGRGFSDVFFFYGENFPLEVEFPGVKFPEEILLGEICQIYKIRFIFFSLATKV